jgi:putative transcription factor
LRCEVCGRRIVGEPHRVIIERAKLAACSECAKLGKGTWEEPKPKLSASKTKPPTSSLTFQIKKPSEPKLITTEELVENFGVVIRRAREKLGLSHEQLGKKINEKMSLLRKIETGSMAPDNLLALKLERTLKVKVLVSASEEKVPEARIPRPMDREVTLGDLIELDENKEKKGEPPARKQS